LTSGVPHPRRVMVGTDRSETAEQAVRWAAGFADRFGAELHLVQVVIPNNGSQTATLNDELLRYARSIAGDRGHAAVVIDEDPALAIVRAAEENSIDVLVVGNAGMAGRRQFLLGNVPNRISHNARCTVIIVNTYADRKDGPAPSAPRPSTIKQEESQPHRFARGSKIAAVFLKHGLREMFGQPDENGATGRRRQAKRLRAALEELGPTFAKIGQILSTRPDLLPPEFIEELSELRDHVTPLSEEHVVRVMEQDLGVPWEDVFETIAPQPLAAGTIAQVHRATLATGDKVVVKVQRPDAKELIEQDLALLKVFAETVGERPKVRQLIDVPAVFEHLSSSLHQELDFRLEARNAERMRTTLASFPRLSVPQIHTHFSTSRLLVMQDVGGVPVSEVSGNLRKEVARQLLESFYQQILIDGFFHADPHPGNLMWQPVEERLYFLDLGMVGEVSEHTRELLILLLMALWQNDAAFMAEVTMMLSGATDRSDLDMDAFSREVQELMAKYRGASITDIQLGPLLQAMAEVSFRHGVPLPASLTLTTKALAQMQLAAAQLDPEVDPFEVAGRFLTRSLVRRLVAKADAKSLFYESQKLKVRATRVLEAVERVVGARPGHKLEVNIQGASLEQVVRRASREIALGFIAGFAMLASAVTAASGRVSSMVSIFFGITGAVFALALILDVWIRKTGKNG